LNLYPYKKVDMLFIAWQFVKLLVLFPIYKYVKHKRKLQKEKQHAI
jgi:hypothetical protein